MRSLFFILSLLMLSAAAFAEDISRNPKVTLAHEELFLAFVESDPEIVLNEYIRKNDTLDNWKVLFAVRYVRTAKSVDEVVQRWKAYIEQIRSLGKKFQEDDESNANDWRFTVSIRPIGDTYLENDQLRFIPGPNGKGVIYYQAAIRVNPTDQRDIMQERRKQMALPTL